MTENKRFVHKYDGMFHHLLDMNKKNFDTQKIQSIDECVDLLNTLHEENEQLKAQLKKGEDVCSICKHQYLTETSIDRYYIAKCKKEHNECSRGTVNYCEDFEYKEIIE